MEYLLIRRSSGSYVTKNNEFQPEILCNFSSIKYNTCRVAKSCSVNFKYASISDQGTSVSVWNKGRLIFKVKCSPEAKIALSSTARYLVVCDAFSKESKVDNLRVYDTSVDSAPSEIAPVFSAMQKKENDWSFQWSKDDKLAAILLKGYIYLFINAFNDAPIISSYKVITFVLDPFSEYLSIVSPEVDDSYTVKIVSVANVAKDVYNFSVYTPNVNMLWSNQQTLLVHVNVKSYDRVESKPTTKLTLYSPRKPEENHVNLSFQFENQCIKWSPDGAHFCCVNIREATLQLYDGQKARNFSRIQVYLNQDCRKVSTEYSGDGQVMAIGEKLRSDSTIKLIRISDGVILCMCESGIFNKMEFSRDSKHLLVCCLSPSLKVNNNFKIFDCLTGRKLKEFKVDDQLLSCTWLAGCLEPSSQDFAAKLANCKPRGDPLQNTCNPHDEKLYRKLMKKIEDINKLKKQQENGVILQRNQLAKIATEISIINQLNTLNISL